MEGHGYRGRRAERDRCGRGHSYRRSCRAVRGRGRPIVTATEATFIFFVAGEPSGDALGGALIAALRQRIGGNLRIAGIGGERMQDPGLENLVSPHDLAVMGGAPVRPRAPASFRRGRATATALPT